MLILFDTQLQTLSSKNNFFKEKTFLELIDEKKLYALIISKNVCMTTKKWWEDTLFQTGEIPNEHNFLKLMYRSLIKKKQQLLHKNFLLFEA